MELLYLHDAQHHLLVVTVFRNNISGDSKARQCTYIKILMAPLPLYSCDYIMFLFKMIFAHISKPYKSF